MRVDIGGRFEKGIVSKQGIEASVRRVLIAGFSLLVVVATVLPASMAGAQSQFLEGVDLLYRDYFTITNNVEDRLSDDFLGAMMRMDAGEFRRYTVAGVYDPGVGGAPEREANGFYVGYHSGTVERDVLAGYDGDTDSFTVGYERWRGNTLLSFNLASTKAVADFIDTDFADASEDQRMLSFGGHFMGLYRGTWTYRGRLAGFVNSHDYGATILGISETADYDSSGINGSGMIGCLIRLGRAGILLPEIGGEYLYAKRDSFTTDAGISLGEFKDNQITGNASLRWTKQARLLDIDVVPSIAAGAKMMVITDDKIGEVQTVGGTSMYFTKDQDEILATASASLLVNVTGHLQATLSYDGAFGDDSTQHLVSLRIRFPY